MIGFLILHYKTIQDTRACVSSIQKLDFAGVKKYILIVDNGSADGTYEKLAAQYQQDDEITVMTTGKNLGFSAGNNAGWKNFPHPESVEYLIVCNSDVVFFQTDFVPKLYALDPFDVLGPDILVPRGKRWVHDSPIQPLLARKTVLQDVMAVQQLQVAAWRSGQPAHSFKSKWLYPSFSVALRQLCYTVYLVLYRRKRRWFSVRTNNAIVQGACLIFSKRYLDRYEKLFDPEPFLYYEEILLWLKAQRDQLTILYEPSLKVYHLEGRATSNTTENELAKKLFVIQHMLESEKMVLEQLDLNSKRMSQGKKP